MPSSKSRANYVRPVNRRELLESALKGMLQNLDPHSQFINTSEWKPFKKQIEGRFGGIGIQVGMDPDANRLKVIAPMVGTPAYEAGILAGDLILEIDGQSTEGMTPDKAVEVLTGRPGTPVKLTVLHEDDEKTEKLTITRAIIDVPSVLGDSRKADDSWDFMLDKDSKIGYVRITSFIQNTTDELKKALDELKAEGMKGLVLDLRDNPGGLLSAAVEISDLFLDDGLIVSTKGRNTVEQDLRGPEGRDLRRTSRWSSWSTRTPPRPPRSSRPASRTTSAPRSSASAAYGKGSVQNIIDLEDGNSVLKLTVATYHRPSGKNIHRFKNAKDSDEWGVSPDPGLEVKLTPAAITRTGPSAAATATSSRHAAAASPRPERQGRSRRTTKRRTRPRTKEKAEERCQAAATDDQAARARTAVACSSIAQLEQGPRGDQGRSSRQPMRQEMTAVPMARRPARVPGHRDDLR